jgi:hypothetical protein
VPTVVVDHSIDDVVGAGLHETKAAHDTKFEAGDELWVLNDRE